MTPEPASNQTTEEDIANEAAQNVADEVNSYEHGSEPERIKEQLDQGLGDAGVQLDPAERDRVAAEIRDGDGAPEVDSASPQE